MEGAVATAKPHRVLVLANETANSDELLDELRRIGADRAANYFVVGAGQSRSRPGSPRRTARST